MAWSGIRTIVYRWIRVAAYSDDCDPVFEMMTRFMVAVFAVGASACALDPAADRRDPRALDEEQAGSKPETATAVTPGAPAPPPAACITPPNLQNEVVPDAAVNGESIQRCCPSAA